MTIPECRDALTKIAERLPLANTEGERRKLARQMLYIVSEMYRRPPVRQAPRRARGMTPQLRAQAVALAAQHPDKPMREIGRMIGVDGGRVSEAVAGFRT